MQVNEFVIAGKIPGERIATQIETTDSDTFTNTPEVTVSSVTAALVQGRTYRVTFIGHASSSVGTDSATFRLYEDSSATEIQIDRVDVSGSTTAGMKIYMEREYTALVTGNKTFTVTGARSAGTGNCRLEATGTRPAYFYVDYVYGP